MPFRERHELTREQVRRTGRPWVRRLRHDEIVTLARQAQRIARVVRDDVDPRIRERVDGAQLAEPAVGFDYLGLELDDVDRVHDGRILERDAAAEADREHRLGVGARGRGQRRKPLVRLGQQRRAFRQHGGFGQPVAEYPVRAALILDEHRGRAAHGVVQLPARSARFGRERRSLDDGRGPGRRVHEHGERGGSRGHGDQHGP